MGLLDGKVGLIVGIANERSYAWHIARSLREQGAVCGYTHLPGEKNERRTRRAITALGDDDPWLVSLDARNDADLDAAFEAYGARFDRLDFLIHSIAYADRQWLNLGGFTGTPREVYLSAIDISAYSLVAMAQRARPMMADGAGKGRGGAILAMSYYGAQKIVPGYNIMGVAKAALECSARYLAGELGEQGIRVNTISGGYLRTLASSAVGGVDDLEAITALRAPLRRNTEGSDVGGTAVWLVSDLGAGVTGQNIFVDCGVSAVGV